MVESLRSEVKTLIGKNDIEAAIGLLEKRIVLKSGKHAQVILIHSRYIEMEECWLSGCIDFREFRIERSRIVRSIMALTDRLSFEDIDPRKVYRPAEHEIEIIVECASFDFDVCFRVPNNLIVVDLKKQILASMVDNLNVEYKIEEHRIYAILETTNGSPLNENLTLKENNIGSFQRLRVINFIWD